MLFSCKTPLLGFLVLAFSLAPSTSAEEEKAFDAVHEILANITRAMLGSNEELAKTIGKFEAKLNAIEQVLLRLKNASDTKESDGVTSLCESTCGHKVDAWVNQTGNSLERLNVCLERERKAMNACDPSPCLYGGKCRLNSTGSGYECMDCPKRTSGIHCQDVECAVEKRCWGLNGTLYTVFETELNWTAAKVKCESENMTMAMPKDQESTEFLVDQLGPIYKDPHNYIWMGLLRVREDGKGWRWVDGSKLGQYTGGREYIKSVSGTWFGMLYFTNSSLKWSYGDSNRPEYVLCQTQLTSHYR